MQSLSEQLQGDIERRRQLDERIQLNATLEWRRLASLIWEDKCTEELLRREFDACIAHYVGYTSTDTNETLWDVIAKQAKTTAPVIIKWLLPYKIQLDEANFARLHDGVVKALPKAGEELASLRETRNDLIFTNAFKIAIENQNWKAAYEFFQLLKIRYSYLKVFIDALAKDAIKKRDALQEIIPKLPTIADPFNGDARHSFSEFPSIKKEIAIGNTQKVPVKLKSPLFMACELGSLPMLFEIFDVQNASVSTRFLIQGDWKYIDKVWECDEIALSALDIAAWHNQWHCLPLLLSKSSVKDEKTCKQLKEIEEKYPFAFLQIPVYENPTDAQLLVYLARCAALKYFYHSRSNFFIKNDDRTAADLLMKQLNEMLTQGASFEAIARHIKVTMQKAVRTISHESYFIQLMNSLKDCPAFFTALKITFPELRANSKVEEQYKDFCEQLDWQLEKLDANIFVELIPDPAASQPVPK